MFFDRCLSSLLQRQWQFLFIAILFVSAFAFSQNAMAQGMDMRKVEVEGTVKLESIGIENASVTVFKNNQFLQEVRTGKKGDFEMLLDLSATYRLEITAEGMITKRFVIDTKIPFDAALDIRLTFDFIVGLFPWFDDPDLSILDQPIGLVKYDTRLENFNYDKDYTKTIITRLEQLIKRYNAKIKEYNQAIGLGDTYFNMAQFPKARENYVKANLIFPKEKYPIDRIAEIDRMSQAKLDDEALYKQLIIEADQHAAAKVYTLALAKYEHASDLKPNEMYPKNKIYEIGKIVYTAEEQQRKYSQLIMDGDNAFNAQEYAKAVGLYERALRIKPEEAYPKSQIERAKGILSKQSELKELPSVDERYRKIIELADKNFAEEKYVEAKDMYIQANMMKPVEQYPKDQLAKISDLLLKQKAIDEAYARAIDMGNKLFNELTYQPALDNYQRALNYKPNEQYPKDKIEELRKILASLSNSDQAYKDAIAEADQLLEAQKLKEAREKYTFAASIRVTEQYPKVQIVRIDNMLADITAREALNAKYKKFLEDGDRMLATESYDMALTAYQQASQIKPVEQYPKDQMAKINMLLAQKKNKEEQYARLIEYAEKTYVSKDYNNALVAYQKALGLKPGEELPTKRIDEINKILAEQQGAEQAYKNVLIEADNLLTAKDYAKAKSTYQKASGMKPGEQYPKDQIVKIDRLIAEELASKSTEEKYKLLIAQADKYYTATDYNDAKKSYTEATALKPSEAYPREQIAKIDKLFADAQANEAAYAKLITAGDQLFGAKTYDKALVVFEKASSLKPAEKYPKEKMEEINKILLSQQGVETAYKNAIAEADAFFTAQDYYKAKTAYQKAGNIKTSEQYPKDQVAKIDKLLADQMAAKSTDEKYKSLIAQADKYFTAAEYTNARTAYVDASAIKSAETYPREQVAKIDKILADAQANEAAYAKLITAGDQLFGAKTYDKALLIFEKASALKPQEKYPKDKIAEINKLLAAQQGVEASYKNAIAEADGFFTAQDYNKAKTSYQKASGIKPSEQYPKDQVAKIDKLLADQLAAKSTDEKYKSLIAQADKYFTAADYTNARTAYIDASAIKSAETYPREQVAKIDKMLADAQANEAAYAKLIVAGDQLFNAKSYDKALLIFEKASTIKAQEKYPKDKIAEINKLLLAQQGVETSYKNAIAEADGFFTAQDYNKAKTSYQKASGIKPSEQYPKDQVAKIDKLLADQLAAKSTDEKYKSLIAQADKYFTAADYTNARTAYVDASAIKSAETYPREQVAKIDKMLADAQANEAAYAKLIVAGDQLFNAKSYDKALLIFEKASTIKAQEKYPKDKIAEINKLLAAQQGIEASYKNAIAEADGFFTAQDYNKAKSSYQKASGIKPTEQYPKDQVAKIDKLLADQLAAKSTDEKYKSLIAQADKYFASADYTNAKTSYTDASAIKTAEQYPKDQIAKINKLLSEAQANDAAYSKLITAADQLFNAKAYDKALLLYEKASTTKPAEKYPKDKMAEINKLMAAQQDSEAKYKAAIAEGDRLYGVKDYNKAVEAYQKASGIKPAEQYPKDQIAKINSQLAGAKQLEADYTKAIADGDKALLAKDYTTATTAYKKASELKPSEQYPKDKLAEINMALAALRTELYKKAVADADALLLKKDYNNAITAYEKASKIIASEVYPKQKIAEINKILEGQKATETSYNAAIAAADKAFTAGDYQNAKISYQMALKYKANELHPTTRIAECDKKLAEMATAQQDYQKFVAEADRLFGVKDYVNARTFYVKANGKKPNEAHPQNRIKEIDGIIENARKAEYDKVIGQADYFYNSKDYKSAKEAYLKASNLMSSQQYPKDRVAEINRMMSSEGYSIAIAKADQFFNAKDYANARGAYMEALGMRSNEPYPRQRIQECNKYLKATEFASAIDQIKSEFIESNTTRRYAFKPLANRSTSNYLSIKARNLSGKPFKIILNFGVDDSNVGGVVINIENNSDVVLYTPLVGEQSGWVMVENNWMSLSPVGGDVEILGIEIKQGTK